MLSTVVIIRLRLFQEKLHSILRLIITNEGKNKNTNEYWKIDGQLFVLYIYTWNSYFIFYLIQ